MLSIQEKEHKEGMLFEKKVSYAPSMEERKENHWSEKLIERSC